MLRRSPRTLGLWAGAVALAVATGAVVAGDLAALHRRAGTLGAEQPVVVARRSLPLGTTVTPADVTTRRVHASQQPRGVLHDPEDAVGRVVRVPVVHDAFVHTGNLAPRGRDGLAGVLPEGTRAVRISVENGLHPLPGSAVDVYASYASGSDALGTGRVPTGGASVVAAGAVVLATDRSPSGASDTLGRGDGVTLLVDEDQAAALADASARGSLFLALVPPEDARVPTGFTPR
ncbi:MAG: Flp pilus assembly protein CpaB [Acidimicrobiia bacterium]|jgi:Flp pilus assembly protein CpaB